MHDNPMLKKTIYIYSPSGAVRDRAAFNRGVRRLTRLGYEVEVDVDALSRQTRFAGDDATRIKAVSRACASAADVALISRGGYGLTRILDDLNYQEIEKAIDRGTQFVGISDFTAFQLAVLTKIRRMTWAGPALCEGFGVGGASKEAPDDIMEDCFNDLILGRGEGTGWRQDRHGFFQSGDQQIASEAVVWGGNLSVLTSMIGTRYFPQIEGGILFLEDVAEHPYRIERMLSQLFYSGVLNSQKAILLGQFTDYNLSTHDRGFKLKSVIDWLRSKLNIPVLTNLPYGHVQTKVLIPFGAKADLAVSGRDAMLFWGH